MDCILWPADHIKPNGYGWLSFDGKVVYAHRWALGFPTGQVGHLCHDRAAAAGECAGGPTCIHRRCVNPEHLTVMTAGENLGASPLTRVARRYDTHCQRGHEFTPENTIWESKGRGYRGRRCRTCKRERERIRSSQQSLQNQEGPDAHPNDQTNAMRSCEC